MPFIATLIGSRQTPLTAQHIAEAKNLIGPQKIEELAPAEAADFFCAEDVRAVIQPWAMGQKLDVIVQPAANRRKKALLADMESTIIEQEMLDELAAYVGKQEEVREITRRSMNSELDFRAALKERLALLKGISSAVIGDLQKIISYMDGARDLVGTMRKHGAECVLVSGGFTCFIEPVAARLGFHRHYGNSLDVDGAALSGRMIEPVLDKDSKRRILAETATRLAISEQDICAVGDGANDVPMLQAAGLGIAFHGKPAVQQQVTHNIRFAGLRGLLWAQGYRAGDLIQ